MSTVRPKCGIAAFIRMHSILAINQPNRFGAFLRSPMTSFDAKTNLKPIIIIMFFSDAFGGAFRGKLMTFLVVLLVMSQ